MTEQPLHILQVSTADIGGGAERVAWSLFQSYRLRGHASWLAVGRKISNDSDVFLIPNGELQKSWSRLWLALSGYLASHNGSFRGAWRLNDLVRGMAEPRRWLDQYRGIEDFHFPGTWHLLKLSPQVPKILHFHNLHGGYADLRVIPWLSQQQPVVLTLHDAWLLSGHCAHSLDCERWKAGCGQCPDLTISPAIRRDMTEYNWRRKRELYTKSHLYVVTPSRWLMEKVKQSMLAPAVLEARVIPNGVDLTVFRSADKQEIRAVLGLPQDTKVFVFAANGIRRNVYKDYSTMRAAISLVGKRLHAQKVLFIALGEDSLTERNGEAEIRFIPYQKSREAVARYYQAADVYLHAARADTFPNTVLEALACGTPVVATAVGGIPEQVKRLELADGEWRMTNLNRYGMHEATGILVPPGDAAGMAVGIERLLNDDSLRARMGENAAKDARERFDLQRQADSYLAWYKELLQRCALKTREKHALYGA